MLKKTLEPNLSHIALYLLKRGLRISISIWFKQSKLDFPDATNRDALGPRFADRKITVHRAYRSDERAFLWNVWLHTEWKAGLAHQSALSV